MTEDEKLELETLKERADLMNITYHPSIGLEKLREKVNSILASAPNGTTTPILDKRALRKKASRLVRVVITCMDTNKKDWLGDYFMAGNSTIGMIKKYVPFDKEFHVPEILLNVIRSKKHPKAFKTGKKDGFGDAVIKWKDVPTYGIRELPPLTEEELSNLAESQRARQAIDEE